MKRFFIWFISVLLWSTGSLLVVAQQASPSVIPTSEEGPEARSRALELAGAFANEGYKLRDGFWCDTLAAGQKRWIEVNLFDGNEYWFSVGGSSQDQRFTVSVFDENGNPVKKNSYQNEATAAAGVEPSLSGKYFVQVEQLDGKKSEFCLVYSYK